MEIDPYIQLAMMLAAFLWGVLLGGAWELVAASRILFGAYEAPEAMRARYERPLPLLRRPVPFTHQSLGRRTWRSLVVAVGDCLFCILFAVVVILLLYRYNDGAFRLSVPVLAIGGFALFRLVSVRLLSFVRAYLAYGFAAGFLYLRALLALPPKGMRYLALRFLVRPVRRLYRNISARRMRRLSAILCAAQLAWAEVGLTGDFPDKNRVRKKKERKDASWQKIKPREKPRPHNG